MATIYCDSLSDELLAKNWLTGGIFSGAQILRLPQLRQCAGILRDILEWERLDWIVEVQGQVRCAVELSRHGYTGDNSFQRFARLYRCAELGVPVIYFTSFSRTRLNEIEDGRLSPRNVAPELFQTLETMSMKFNVPCLAIDWPTGTDGTPLPLTSQDASPALQQMVNLVRYFSENSNVGANADLPRQFWAITQAMRDQASLPFTGGVTRTTIKLPIDMPSNEWVLATMPPRYFETGKADKCLASLALSSICRRPLIGPNSAGPWWGGKGLAQLLFLGYQWRPDPACGLIALSSVLAKAANAPLIVVWPRVFSADNRVRRTLLKALEQFANDGTGLLGAEIKRLGYDGTKIAAFRSRISTDAAQFGLLGMGTKTGRILSSTTAAIVLGDAVYVS